MFIFLERLSEIIRRETHREEFCWQLQQQQQPGWKEVLGCASSMIESANAWAKWELTLLGLKTKVRRWLMDETVAFLYPRVALHLVQCTLSSFVSWHSFSTCLVSCLVSSTCFVRHVMKRHRDLWSLETWKEKTSGQVIPRKWLDNPFGITVVTATLEGSTHKETRRNCLLFPLFQCQAITRVLTADFFFISDPSLTWV